MPRKPDAPSWRNAAQCLKGARQRARVAAPDFVAAYFPGRGSKALLKEPRESRRPCAHAVFVALLLS